MIWSDRSSNTIAQIGRADGNDIVQPGPTTTHAGALAFYRNKPDASLDRRALGRRGKNWRTEVEFFVRRAAQPNSSKPF